MTNTAPEAGEAAPSKARPLGFLAKFAVFNDAIPELWLTFAIKLLAFAAYQVTNITLTLWLESDLHCKDTEALAWVGAWSIAMTIASLLVGTLTDVLGIRRTMFIGTALCIFTRAIITFVTVKWVAIGIGLLPLAIGEALGGPVLIAAARQYSNTRQRSMSFSMSYVMMNLGFLIAPLWSDYLRRTLGEHGQWHLFSLNLSTYRTLFLTGLILEASVLPLIFLLREGVEASDEGIKRIPARLKYHGGKLFEAIGATMRHAFHDSVSLFATLWKQAGFYRLMGFLMLIAFLKLIFMQTYYVYPIFGIRELGPKAPVGHLMAINNLLIVFIVPVIGALTQRFSAYAMVIVGGLFSAASVFVMAMPTDWFISMANGWVGNLVGHWYLGLAGVVHPYYVMIAIFVILLSLGEAFYSPRVYEYAAAIAPKGQEASYSALSYVPFLLAKLLIGAFGGVLLARYCPETGPRHSETMWLMVALVSLITPLGLITLRRFIRVHEAGRM